MHRLLTSILPRGAALVSIAIAVSALAGWALGVDALKSVMPREAPVEANTAVGIALAAGALWAMLASATPQRRDVFVAATVFVLGLVTLSQYVFELDFAIDELLFTDASDLPGNIPGRMSPYSA